MTNAEVSILVARAARGDPRATEELARRYDPPLRRFVHRRIGPDLRSRVDTDDICQSAFFAAFESLPNFRFRGERPFLSWLSSIAEQKIRNAGRRHRALRRDARRDRALEHAREMPTAGTSPTQGATRSETVRGIRAALEELPPREREVVRLHSFDGRSFREIAEELDLADKSTARRIFLDALKRIGHLLDGP